MTPVNRVRPTDAEIQSLRQQLSLHQISVAEIAKRYGIDRSAVYRWFRLRKPRVFMYQKDPAGFDAACLEVSRGHCTIFATSRKWQAGPKRVRDRVLALTGQPAKRYCPTKVPGQPTREERKQMRLEAEKSKRERLRRELEALLKQPYRVAA